MFPYGCKVVAMVFEEVAKVLIHGCQVDAVMFEAVANVLMDVWLLDGCCDICGSC